MAIVFEGDGNLGGEMHGDAQLMSASHVVAEILQVGE